MINPHESHVGIRCSDCGAFGPVERVYWVETVRDGLVPICATCRAKLPGVLTPIEADRNGHLAWDFYRFCRAHPELRFWQALRTWSDADRIDYGTAVFDADTQQLRFDFRDTFNWEGKDG